MDLRVLLLGDLGRGMTHQRLARQVQQARLRSLRRSLRQRSNATVGWHACRNALAHRTRTWPRRRPARPAAAPCARARRPPRSAARLCARNARAGRERRRQPAPRADEYLARAPPDRSRRNETRRRGTSVSPYSATRSLATTSPRAASQLRIEIGLRRRDRRRPASIHSGSILAAQRAYRRVVSVSSAASTHFAPSSRCPIPGAGRTRMPRAPR